MKWATNGLEEPQSDGGEYSWYTSGTSGTGGTAGTAGTPGTGSTTGTVAIADGADSPDPDCDTEIPGYQLTNTIHDVSRMTADTRMAGRSTGRYEKPLDTHGHLGHGMGPREHSFVPADIMSQRDMGLLNLHRPGTKATSDTAGFKFFAAGVT